MTCLNAAYCEHRDDCEPLACDDYVPVGEQP